MTQLSTFQKKAAALALVKMFKKQHFDICTLDAIARTLGVENTMAGPDYAALRALHCIDWVDMGTEMASMTKHKCLEMLGLSPETIIETEPAPPPQESAPRHPSGLLSLFKAR